MIAFLPPKSLGRLRNVFPNHELRRALSWTHLGTLVKEPGVAAAVIDPNVDGTSNVGAAVEVLRKNPLLPIFAYVFPTPANLRAVLQLSKYGLEDAFLCGLPDIDRNWQKALEKACGRRVAFALLRAMETRITRLPSELNRTVVDVFERPHRYDCGVDIAREAGIGVRSLYRDFERAGLGSPKRMLTAAKLARGYTYLVSSSMRLDHVTQSVRYSRPRLFSEAITEVFGCSPSNLRKQSDSNEVVLQLLEWLYKPASLRVKRKNDSSAELKSDSRSASTSRLIKAPCPVADSNKNPTVTHGRP